MRFLIRVVVIAVLISLVMRIIRAALQKRSGGVEVIPPARRQTRHSEKVVVESDDAVDPSRGTARR
jgi:hypothetical protein